MPFSGKKSQALAVNFVKFTKTIEVIQEQSKKKHILSICELIKGVFPGPKKEMVLIFYHLAALTLMWKVKRPNRVLWVTEET